MKESPNHPVTSEIEDNFQDRVGFFSVLLVKKSWEFSMICLDNIEDLKWIKFNWIFAFLNGTFALLESAFCILEFSEAFWDLKTSCWPLFEWILACFWDESNLYLFDWKIFCLYFLCVDRHLPAGTLVQKCIRMQIDRNKGGDECL